MSELNLASLEERKLKEIEHSRKRRTILQGYERSIDTHASETVIDADQLIRDRKEFEYHFSNTKYYSVTNSSEAYYHDWLRQRCKGKMALDYCCGSGENGVFMGQNGANVIGIDISPEGVANGTANAARAGVSENCKFEVMDAEATDFKDNTFDILVEYGALHHLDYERAMKEMARIIKPSGEIICIEALRHNPFIHLYRKRTMHLRTEWEVEHILSVDHLDISRQYFGKVEARFFHLAVLAAVPFRKTPLFRPLRKVFEAVDDVLLNNKAIGKYGWIMVFTLSNPKK